MDLPFPDDPGFNVERRQEDNATVLRVAGELDLETAPTLRHRLHEAIAECPDALVVDLGGLVFLDSTGISVLVDGLKQTERKGGRFLLRAPTPPIRRVLEITGLLDLFGLPPE